MIRKSPSLGEFRVADFIIVPKDNRLPIRKMSASDCISSHDPQFCYGYPIWDHGGKSENPFYWMNESIRHYYNKATGEEIKEYEPVPMCNNLYDYYQKILDEFHENWIEIVGKVLDHHDETITMKYKHFKVVSNVDTSFMDW